MPVLRWGFLPFLLPALLACGSRTDLPSGRVGDGGPDVEVDAPPDAPPDAQVCSTTHLDFETDLPTVLLLIDQSGSMLANFGEGTRWSTMRRALFDADTGLVSAIDGTVNLGIVLYTSFNGFRGGSCPVLVESQRGVGLVDPLRDWFLEQRPAPLGDTPTGEAISAAVELLAAGPGPKYLILLTDGQPDTCRVPDPQGGGPDAIRATQEAFEQGVRVFTVGVGDEFNPGHLQQMANAGAGKALNLSYPSDDGAAEPLLASDDHSELAAQLRGVLPDERTCEVRLPDTDGSIASIDVRVDGDLLEPGVEYSVEARRVVLGASACRRVLTVAGELTIEQRCL